MASDAVLAALASLKAELADVDQQLEAYERLHARRRRLVDAIRSLEAIDTFGPGRLTHGFADFAELVHRAHLEQLQSARAGAEVEPPTPSSAAMRILEDVGRPLHIREIVALIQRRGWYTERSYESLRGTIAGTLDSKVGKEVSKPTRGTYGLLAWEHTAGETSAESGNQG